MKLIIFVQDDNGMIWAEEEYKLSKEVSFDLKQYKQKYSLHSNVDLNKVINRANKHISDFHE
jgi:hypothetical protein